MKWIQLSSSSESILIVKKSISLQPDAINYITNKYKCFIYHLAAHFDM